MRRTDTSLVECPGCRTRYNPEFSAQFCPHPTIKSKESLTLARLRAAGPPYKLEPWIQTDRAGTSGTE